MCDRSVDRTVKMRETDGGYDQFKLSRVPVWCKRRAQIPWFGPCVLKTESHLFTMTSSASNSAINIDSQARKRGSDEDTRNEWHVTLFRRTITRGWEVYFPNGTSFAAAVAGGSADNEGSKKKGGKNSSNSSSDKLSQQKKQRHHLNQQLIAVTPKRECIEMKQLRLRVPLSSRNSSSKTSSNATTTSTSTTDANSSAATSITGSSGATNIIRRMDTVLLTTKRGGCIVFKFTSLEECISFWDQLVLLNTSSVVKSTQQYDVNSLASSSRNAVDVANISALEDQQRQLIDMSDRVNRRLKSSTTEDRSDINPNDSASNPSSYKEQKTEQFRSMLIRLLHDEDFMDFVNVLEDCLTSTTDGTTILQNAALAGKAFLAESSTAAADSTNAGAEMFRKVQNRANATLE